ncbi:MAG: G5 domain-containing protein [Anaerolineales bacterium]|nr:G5 domain-containing protein [Anaerolineales bacterium]
MRTKTWIILVLLLFIAACNRISNPLRASTPSQITVTVIADGDVRTITTSAVTVAEVLEKAQVHLGELDIVEPGEYLAVEEGMAITVIRVLEQFLTTESEIYYEQKIVRNEALPEGDRRLLQAGQTGLEQAVFRIEYHDGVEVDRRMVKREVLQPAVDEIVMVGVKGVVTPVSIPGTLAYISGGNGVIMRTSSANRTALVTTGDLDGRVFSLSPDGRRLLFTRSVPYTSPLTGTLPAFNSLWIIATTQILTTSRPISLEVESVLWANWSPDGDRVAYSTAKPIPQAPGWEANNDLWLIDWYENGYFSSEQLLESSSGGIYGWWGGQFAWSPNGQYLAYGRANEIGIIDLETGEQDVLQSFSVYHTYSEWVWTPKLTWSPDSLYLAAVVHGPPIGPEALEDSQVFDLWVWAIDDSISLPLSERTGMWSMPAWSPMEKQGPEQASRIAYLQAREPLESANSTYSLWIMDRDGSEARLYFPPEGEIGLQPQPIAWSPEGNQIALVYGGDLYLVNATNSGVDSRPLTSDGCNSNPVWAPWGSVLYGEPAEPVETVEPEEELDLFEH